jgi:hypothetical protein
MQQRIVEAPKTMDGKLVVLLNLIFFMLDSAVISPKNQNYYVGGAAIIEINLTADQEILRQDDRLVQIDKLIINKFINGQFIKNNLYRYEVILKNTGKFELEPFLIQTPTGSKIIQIEAVDVSLTPQELDSVGARLTASTTQALVGQKINIVYEIFCDHDYKVINYEIPEFAKNIDVINKLETKNGNKIKIEFQLVFKESGAYKIGKIGVTSAKNGPLSQLLGFGKTFVSNDLTIEICKINDIFLFIEKPEDIDIEINSPLGESEILTLKSSNYFLTWPKINLLFGKAHIYNSEIKNGKDYSLCQFVVQPLENGPLRLEIFGQVYDVQTNKYHDLSYQKNLIVDLKNQNQLNVQKPELIKQQLPKKSFSKIAAELVHQAIDWPLWYMLILVLMILNLYLIYLHEHFKLSLQSCTAKILFRYYAFLFNLATKKNDFAKARIIAKKLLEFNMADQNFLNILQQMLYNS